MDEISSDDLQCLISSVSLLFVESTSLISDIISERDAANQGGDDLPPVFPRQLINIDMCSLSCVINTHHSRLEQRISSTDINHISANLVQLNCAYREEPLFNIVIGASANLLDFEQCWSVTYGLSKSLVVFCGGLTCVFLNTATVKFRILRYRVGKGRIWYLPDRLFTRIHSPLQAV